MDKLQYFLTALKGGSFLYKGWVIDMFGIVDFRPLPEAATQGELTLYSELDEDAQLHMPYRDPSEMDYFPFEQYPFELFRLNDKIGFISHETKQFVELPWAPKAAATRRPFYSWGEEVELAAGAVVNLREALKASYGEILVNQIIKVYPFGDRFPMTAGYFNLKKFEAEFAPLIASITPESLANPDPKAIYADVLEKRYYPAAFSLSGLTMLSVPAATEYTIDVSPAVRALRKKLLEEHANELHDPVVIANIVGQLVKLDMEDQSKDPDKGFLQPGKAFDVVRAKTFLLHGIERDFDDPSKVHLIERSLSEQWDPRDIVLYVNSIVAGSYGRGFETALGGELAKILIRFFLTNNITTDDCGVRYGREYAVTADNLNDFTNCYAFVGQREVLLTRDDVKVYVGKNLTVRTPLYCKAPEGGFCVHCMGEEFRNRETRLVAHATEVGNVIMYASMSAVHGKALKTVEMDWRSLR